MTSQHLLFACPSLLIPAFPRTARLYLETSIVHSPTFLAFQAFPGNVASRPQLCKLARHLFLSCETIWVKSIFRSDGQRGVHAQVIVCKLQDKLATCWSYNANHTAVVQRADASGQLPCAAPDGV